MRRDLRRSNTLSEEDRRRVIVRLRDSELTMSEIARRLSLTFDLVQQVNREERIRLGYRFKFPELAPVK